ncbi:RNA 2',3'-cyclic phosphodiesterase [Shewanella gaetbuli]|uniref:RNA 2',3'-cyclic phosphodiesterase n=1 Tax=Shewanella gaetbuli TaxID=220752 RepID=A0A9X1ZEY7_9GAMM|nr:RNA 2',3'-cyclic phosphodiesterase [Shewanella gaetbuli]MCL1141119.1 RNA 2',3'-cyclic phosphodiesterase [Shewanella gaetbuli]
MKKHTDSVNKRLFIGFSVKKQHVGYLADIQQELTSIINSQAVAVKPSNFHMTLCFLGQVFEHNILQLISEYDGLLKPTFTIQLDTLDVWPKPRIMCITGEAPAELMAMANSAQDIATRLKLHSSVYPYRPHVTLFRKAKPSTQEINPKFSPVVISPTQLNLYESTSTPAGVKYSIIHHWPLVT